MRKSKLLRMLTALLAILTVVSSLVACEPLAGPSGESGEDSSPAVTDLPTPTEDMKIVEGGNSAFKIIRGENASDIEKSAMSAASKAITDACGKALPLGDDWINEALGYVESEYEILIGKTNRAESIMVYNTLRANDYAVTIVGKKIVIAAFTEEKLNEAVAYFAEKLQASDGNATLLAADAKIAKGTYELDAITVNGVPLSYYKIVYKTGGASSYKDGALALSAAILESFSYNLETSGDAAEETDYEIVFGGTTRGDSQTIADAIHTLDYSITVSGNKVFVIPGASDDAIEAVVTAFVDKLSSMAADKKVAVTGETLNVLFESDTYLTDDITLNGTPISEYTIVYSGNDPLSPKLAVRLKDEISRVSGRRVNVAPDSQNYKNTKEILIGYSKRTAAGGAAASMGVAAGKLGDSEYLMYGEGNFIYLGGAEGDYVALMGAVNKLIETIGDVKDKTNHKIDCNIKTATKATASVYKVITYNDGDNSTTKLVQVSSILLDYAPDIVGMQEVQQMHVGQYELKMKGYKGIYYNHDTNYYGAPIFYRTDRFDVVEHGTQWLSDTPDQKYTKFEESDYIRSYVYAILKDKATGEEIVVVNTHVDYIGEANTKQIKVLLDCTERFRGKPIIYTGDFNMQSTSDGFKQMVDAGLRDCGSYLGYSIKGHIDFCFVDTYYVVPVCYKYIDDHQFSDTASDHCPVYSEIAIVG